MSDDFAAALEERRLLHRKSDLSNLANAHIDILDFQREFNERIAGLVLEIEELAKVEWPPEGMVWDIYNRCQTLSRTVSTAIHNMELKFERDKARDEKYSQTRLTDD